MLTSLCLVFGLSAAQLAPEDRALYARILKAHVDERGRIDYRGLKQKSAAELARYVKAVGAATLPPPAERTAFYIDAYNALVLKSVLAHGRPRSVLDVQGFLRGELHRIAGQEMTLDGLRKTMLATQDPRVHLAVTPGAVSSPRLSARPYAGGDLNARLEQQTRDFLRSPYGAKIAYGQLQLSKLFDWHLADFGGASGVLRFVQRYLPKARELKTQKLFFFDYNWTLNQT